MKWFRLFLVFEAAGIGIYTGDAMVAASLVAHWKWRACAPNIGAWLRNSMFSPKHRADGRIRAYGTNEIIGYYRSPRRNPQNQSEGRDQSQQSETYLPPIPIEQRNKFGRKIVETGWLMILAAAKEIKPLLPSLIVGAAIVVAAIIVGPTKPPRYLTNDITPMIYSKTDTWTQERWLCGKQDNSCYAVK